MSTVDKLKRVFSAVFKPNYITCKAKYLFILSHMRSRSSVLSHVLGSNDGICGYSELHRSYISQSDLRKMRVKLYNDFKCRLTNKYLLDKLLHNNLDISKDVLRIANPKFIFLLRQPENTIKSTINMGYLANVEWYKDPEQVLKYYCSRLSRLEDYAEMIGGNYFFLESDELVTNTEHVLESLTRWLCLDKPLDNSYLQFSGTGKIGYGDPSNNIRTGKIKKTRGYPDIHIPQEILERAESSYEKCKASLMLGSNVFSSKQHQSS